MKSLNLFGLSGQANFQFIMFNGHVWIGAWFFSVGLWWIANVLVRHVKLCSSNAPLTPLTLRFHSRRPWGSWLSIVNGCLFVWSNIWIATDDSLLTKNSRFIQHMVMVVFFVLHNVVNILMHHKVRLPPHLDYFTLVLALVMSAFVFHLHTHDRATMDDTCHSLIVYCFLVTALLSVAECAHPCSTILALMRGCAMAWTGTWFVNVSPVLYPYPWMATWDPNDFEQVKVAVAIFLMHGIAHFVWILTLNLVLNGVYYPKLKRASVGHFVNCGGQNLNGVLMS